MQPPWTHPLRVPLAGGLTIVLAACGDADRPPTAVPPPPRPSREGTPPPTPMSDRTQPPAPRPFATVLEQVGGTARDPYRVTIETMESMPVQFALNLHAQDDGGRCTVDGFTPPDADGVAIVKLRPAGPADAQQPAAAARVALGHLRTGRYTVRLLRATATDGPHRLTQTLTLVAR